MSAARHVATALATAAVAAAGAWPAAAAPALEIAPDGRHAATIDVPAPTAAAPAGSPPLPFAPTPGWQNTLRVQVGGLAFGDLDGNGRPDLAMVNYQSQSFPPYEDWRNYVYFNLDGALEAVASWVSADQRHSGDAAIGDVDGDGFNDLVVANGGGGYAPNVIHFGSAAGLATTPGWLSAQPAWATSLQLVDIDGDGDLDLLTSNQGNGQADPYRPIYLFRNTGGVLATSAGWQSAETSIQNALAVGDVDGDGDPDLAVAKWVNFESALYPNLAGTPAAVPSWTVGSTETDRGVELADMDGDDRLDLVLGVGNTMKIFRNNGDGSFTDVWTAAQTANHQDLLVADFNNDGWPDIVDIDFSTGRAWLYLNGPGLPATTPVWGYDAAASGTALAAADVDGDGWLDLAIGYSGQPSAVLFLNQLAPTADPIFADGFEPPAPPDPR